MFRIRSVVCCGSLLVLFPLAAATAQPDTTRTEIPGLTVTGRTLPWGSAPLTETFLQRHDDGNLGETLENLPGMWAVRRAPSGTEPVIRGLGFERVQTRLGAIPLHGACPGRMDPPVTYLSGLSGNTVTVTRSAGAAAGAGGPAGTILVDPDFERAPGTAPGFSPFVAGGYQSARSGYRVEAGVTGGSDAVDLRAGLGYRRLENYEAPDGREVPARLREGTADLSLGWRPAAGQRLWTAANYVHEQDIDYPALPMDNRETDFLALNAGWRVERDGGLRRFALTGGYSAVDHLMDNADKANRQMMEAETPAETRTWAVRARADLADGVRFGADVTSVSKDAVRERRILGPTPGLYHDHIWPDAVQLTGGVWADWNRDLGGATTLGLEGRLDRVDSKARAADDPSLGGLTVREQYVRYYGPEAAETDRDETLGQFAARLDGRLGDGFGWHLRSGLAGRAAGITERYFAFGPAPGGFTVGNPTLVPEKAWQNELGCNGGTGTVALGVAVFYNLIDDYVLPTVIDRRDVNGDGNDDVIKGFLNRDAALAGGELALEWSPRPRLRLPASLAYVRGRNTADDRDLPEIPAFSGSAEAWWLAHGGSDTWLLGGARFAADQERIDPLFPENRTGGWTVWRVGLETRPAAGLYLRATVENLFDRLYHDHLTREAVLPTGGLARGDEVPAPGRSFNLSARWSF